MSRNSNDEDYEDDSDSNLENSSPDSKIPKNNKTSLDETSRHSMMINEIEDLRSKVKRLNHNLNEQARSRFKELTEFNQDAIEFRNFTIQAHQYCKETSVNDAVVFNCSEFADAFKCHIGSKFGTDSIRNNCITKHAWVSAAKLVSMKSKSAPFFTSYSGCLDKPEIEKPEKIKRSRKKYQDDVCEHSEPNVRNKNDLNADGCEETSKIVTNVYKILRKKFSELKRPIGYYEFIINPDSFGQSLENMFYLSFLLKDGHARITINSDGFHVIKPISEEKRRTDKESNKGGELSTIFSMTYDEWEEAKNIFKIESSMISRN